MHNPTHHLSHELLVAYAAGTLPQPFALVVAAHLSMCDESRAAYEAHCAAGGALLTQTGSTPLSGDLRARVFDQLDAPHHPAPEPAGVGIYPAPVVEAMGRAEPKWQMMGLGTRQAILSHGKEGSVRLLYIPGGQAVPDHTHGGLELTLVLQGAFADETGRFGPGDLEIADDDLEHTPIAEPGEPCICLAATDARLKFRSLVPRLLQPLFKI